MRSLCIDQLIPFFPIEHDTSRDLHATSKRPRGRLSLCSKSSKISIGSGHNQIEFTGFVIAFPIPSQYLPITLDISVALSSSRVGAIIPLIAGDHNKRVIQNRLAAPLIGAAAKTENLGSRTRVTLPVSNASNACYREHSIASRFRKKKVSPSLHIFERFVIYSDAIISSPVGLSSCKRFRGE